MGKIEWGARVSDDEAARRAAGRAHFNSWRRDVAAIRRADVAQLLAEGLSKASIARRLGVAASTVTRDVQAILKSANAEHTCPICGQLYVRHGGNSER